MPIGDCKDCHDALQPAAPALAPKVMTYWATSGHGKFSGADAVGCTACHNVNLPDPNTHNTGTVNSVWENGTVVTRNSNTAHLNAEYFTPVVGVPVSSGAWDVQVTFDNNCWKQCHENAGATDFRHERDTEGPPLAGNHWSVEFGTHLSRPQGDYGTTWTAPGQDAVNAPYPVDCDLSTDKDCTVGADYAPCISCHDPHGTGISEPSKISNYMLRRKWITPANYTESLCKGCHP
jgi:hypothetical protein